MPPRFTLAVVASADGFIARHPAHTPAGWASPDEQARFRAAVAAADWCILGRRTHEAAHRPDRRRIVFSTGAPGWRRPTQRWLDPAGITPADLPAIVAAVHPLANGLILGGTGVHDWFHAHAAIHRVLLTIEPVAFGSGLPIFAGPPGAPHPDPLAAFLDRGYRQTAEETLNPRGTRLVTLTPPAAAAAAAPRPARGPTANS